ncbi:hypothetical protein DPMN_115652 [Dreissena polymorpha]|uniref:Uncharacterized protein n=1 Tax=Dreissena polymorpha TaxID=45954 RepID=A0A9D4QT45_DREPO|nr:hypothetical protein DPMN_115652 [Dreissena polymorpha]
MSLSKHNHYLKSPDAIPSRLTSGGSPSRSPKRSPSQFESATDGHMSGMRRNLSNKSLDDKVCISDM